MKGRYPLGFLSKLQHVFHVITMDLQEKIPKVSEVLNDSSKPLKERFRALFTLRNIGGEDAINAIEKCFKDTSALLKHELAYCLGQMQDKRAIPALVNVLKDEGQEPMVRHEAGEALGAIGDESVLEVLEKYASDPQAEVAETCQLAINRLRWINENGGLEKIRGLSNSKYLSVDPAPPDDSLENVEELKKILLDDNEDLFKRYKAMFTLRNISTPESVTALCLGLTKGGALFRHEIAFVLGQMQEESSVPYLINTLQDETQNEMVRHECAEALGSIATDQCVEILKQYLYDKSRVVRESCDVALDIADFKESNDFQYANTATSVEV